MQCVTTFLNSLINAFLNTVPLHIFIFSGSLLALSEVLGESFRHEQLHEIPKGLVTLKRKKYVWLRLFL